MEFKGVLYLLIFIAEGFFSPIEANITDNANFMAFPSWPPFLSFVHNI